MDLSVELAGVVLPHPVLVAAGCGGTGAELHRFTDIASVAGFVTRTITLDPVEDPAAGALARVSGSPSGVVAADGWPNPGLQSFLTSELPLLAASGARTFVSVAGRTLAEYAELARRLGTAPGVCGLEVTSAERDPLQLGRIVHVSRRDLPRGMPLLVKLAMSPLAVEQAQAAAENGADSVVLGRGPDALCLEPSTLAPRPGSAHSTLSGPAVRPLALRTVYDVHAALPHVPLVGVGGVCTGRDALAMLAAGASAVQLGTVLLSDPAAPGRVVDELAEELSNRRIDSVRDVVGVAQRAGVR